MDHLADAGRARRRQDPRRRRMGARRHPASRRLRARQFPDRAGRRNRTRRPRSDDRRRVRSPVALHDRASGRIWISSRRPARMGERRGARRCFPPRIPTVCAGRNSPPPGSTSSPSGVMPKQTFDMLQFGLAPRRAAAAGDHDDAAADRADQAAARRPAHRGDARGDAATTRAIWRRRFSTRWWRAMPARGSAARKSTARSSRSAPTRCGRAR